MTTLSFALIHCGDEGAKAHVIDLVIALRRQSLATRCEGKDWTCLSKRPAFSGRSVGAVFGNLFDPDGRNIDVAPPCNSGAPHDWVRQLVDRTWGRYVAVYEAMGAPWVMTDPSGAWPLWAVRAPGLTIVTDLLTPSLMRIAGIDPVIDHQALAATLTDAACATHLSYLAGIQRLTPGCSFSLANRTSATIWDIRTRIANAVVRPAEALCRAIDLAASNLGRENTVLQLSGGFDSAIVLAALAASAQQPPTMNFATHAAGGDERGYARLVAEHCGTSVTEIVASGFPDYRRIAAAQQGATPNGFGLDDLFEAAVDTFAAERNAVSVITGQGGDAVFFQPATPLVTIDRARAFGAGRATWPAILDDARRSRHSIWHHLIPVVSDRWRQSRVPTELLSPHLLTAHARRWANSTDRRHPWSRGIDDLPPGKRMQVAMIANSQIFHGSRASGVTPLHHPLLTQPVLEAALAIPTYTLACGDNDRGLVRHTFADRLPAALIARRSKGEASDHYSRAALANLDFLRDFLLDGRLTALGILDRATMDALLTRDGLFHSLDYSGLPMQVSCEAWVRSWEATDQDDGAETRSPASNSRECSPDS